MRLSKRDGRKALFYAKKIIAQIVTDVVNLEDINYTVPEIQTLLDGITVGGHKIQDEVIAINQINAWRFLFDSLGTNNFIVNYDYCCKLHSLVANQEALQWGKFRDGGVSISGTEYLPPASNLLNSIWNDLANETTSRLLSDKLTEYEIYRIAINLFAKMAKIQFFYDGNKRTARMMMSGILISQGCPMINVSAKRKAEFNQVMINYYNNDKCLDDVYTFMLSCLEPWIIEEFDLNGIFESSVHE